MAISGNPLVTVKVAADDAELQAGLGRGKAGVKAFAEDAKNAAEKTATSWESTSRKVGASLLAFSGAMAAFGASVGKEAAGFEQAMRYVNTSAGLADSGLATLSKTVLDLSVSLGSTKGPQEMAKGLYEIYGAGLKGAEAMEVLKVSTKLATVGMSDVGGASRAVTEIMEAYHLKSSQAAMVGDQVMATVRSGRMHMEQYAGALAGTAVKAANLGVSLEDLGGAMTVLSRHVPAGEAGTSLERLFVQLAAPTDRAGKTLRSLGVDFGRGAIESKGLLNVLLEMRAAFDGSDEKMRKSLQSSPAFTAFLALTADKGKEYATALREVSHAHGTLDETMKGFMQGAIPQWQQLKVLAEQTAISFGQHLLPGFKAVVSGAKEFLTSINSLSDAQKSQIAQGVMVAAGLTAVAGAFLVLAPAIAALPAALGVAAEFAPIVLGATAAVAAVGGLYKAWTTNWGGIKDATVEAVAAVQSSLKDTWNAGLIEAQEIWKVVSADLVQGASEFKREFQATWPTIRDSVAEAWGVISPALTFMGKVLKDELPLVLTYLAESFKVTWGIARDAVGIAWSGIKGVLEGMALLLKGTTNTVSAIIVGDWKGAWKAFSGMVHDEAMLAYNYVKDVLQHIGGLFADAAISFGHMGEKMMDAFVAGLRGKTDDLNKAVAEIREAATGDRLSPQRQLAGWKAEEAKPNSEVATAIASVKSHGASLLSASKAKFDEWLSATPVDRGLALGQRALVGATPTDTRNHRNENNATILGGSEEEDTKKRKKLSRSEMTSYIRQHAGVYGDLGGLDKEALTATYNLILNSVLADVRLQITSAKRHGSGGSFHNSGRAVDIQFADRPNISDDAKGAALIQRLSAGTGFRSGINEFRSDARAVTGGTGPHMHLTTGLESGGVPGTFQPHGSAASAFGSSYKEDETAALKARKDLLLETTDLVVQQHKAVKRYMTDYKKDLEESYNTGHAAAQESFSSVARAISQEDGRSRDKRANYAFENEMGRGNAQARIAEIQAEMEIGHLSASSRIENMRELHGLHQQQVREQIDSARFMREMGQIDDAEMLLRLQLAQAAFVGSDQEKRAMILETHRLTVDLQNQQFASADALSEGMGASLQGFLQNTITGQQTFGAAFSGLWKGIMNSIVQEITKAIVKALALKAIMRGIFSFFGGIFGGLFGGITSIGTGAEVAAMDAAGSGGSLVDAALPAVAHTGGLVVPGGIQTFHQGGLVGAGLSLRSDEVLAKLQTGEMVLSRQHLARARANEASQSGRSVQISFGDVHMNSGEDPAAFTDRLGRDLAFRIQGL